MKRTLALGLAALWGLALAASVAVYLADLGSRLPWLLLPAPQQAEIVGGDGLYHRFLLDVARAVPADAKLLLFVNDAVRTRKEDFLTFRASYVLYPVQHLFVTAPGLVPPPGDRFAMAVHPRLAALVREQAIELAAIFVGEAPERGGVFRITEVQEGSLSCERVDVEALAPRGSGADGATRPWAWPLGLAALMATGWWLGKALGLLTPLDREPWAAAAVAFLLGCAAIAWTMQMAAFAGLGWSPAVAFAPLLPAVWLWWWRRRTAAPATAAPGERERRDGWAGLAGRALVWLAVAAAAVEAFVPMPAWKNWDAWVIWSLKVRAFWTARTLPLDFLTNAHYSFSHPDYPPGVPLVQTALAFAAGGPDETLQRLLAPAFLLSFAGLAAALAGALGAGRWRWLLAGTLALTPRIFEQGHSGYMDLTVATAAAAALLLLVHAGRGSAPAWAPALLAGTASLFKNEGLVWVVGIAATLVAWTLARRLPVRATAAALALLAVVAAPWRIAVHAWDLEPTFEVRMDRLAGRLADGLPVVVRATAHEAFGTPLRTPRRPGETTPGAAAEWLRHVRDGWLLFWFAFAAALLAGWRALLRFPGRELALLMALQIAATLAVYLGSRYDLETLVLTSVERILLQLTAPALALGTVAAAAALEVPPRSGRHDEEREKW